MLSSSQDKTLPIYLPSHCPYCCSKINDRTVCMSVFLCPHIKRTWVFKCHWMDSSRLSYIKRNAICCYYCVKPRKLNSNSRSTTLLLLSVSIHLFFFKYNINKSSRSFTKHYCISYLQTLAYHYHVCHINTVWLFVNYPPFHHRSLHHHPLHQPPKASNCACHTHRPCILHCVSTPSFGCQLSLGLCICFKSLSSSSLDCVRSLHSVKLSNSDLCQLWTINIDY